MPVSMRVVAGLGFRAGCEHASLRSALHATLDAASQIHGQPMQLALLCTLATAADKAGHPALLQLAAELQLPITPVPLPQLATQAAASSNQVPQRYGARSVAEAAALAAAGPGATLLVPRHRSHDRCATAALAVALGEGGRAQCAALEPGHASNSKENTLP